MYVLLFLLILLLYVNDSEVLLFVILLFYYHRNIRYNHDLYFLLELDFLNTSNIFIIEDVVLLAVQVRF